MILHDAVVIGAGPAGATAALLLARHGRSVVLVEKSAFPRRKVCGEFISATTWPLLRELGVAGELLVCAGPAVRRVGLFAGEVAVEAPMPERRAADPWGRAIGREHLDTALRDAAARGRAEVLQPWSATALRREAGGFVVEAVAMHGGSVRELHSRTVICAHGSWEHGALATQAPHAAPRPGDLLGFKAHFRGARLAPGLMPLVLFPGGYGGLVHSDGARVSFSCCIRREALRGARAARRGLGAGAALLEHVMASCRGVREALHGAERSGAWLAAGPIHPGIRVRCEGGWFTAGNAAGEAHPLVAEGISMAIQSACLLGERLAATDLASPRELDRAARDYALAWRRNFATRLRAASAFAALTSHPATAGATMALLARAPALLTRGAAWSGKARELRRLAPVAR